MSEDENERLLESASRAVLIERDGNDDDDDVLIFSDDEDDVMEDDLVQVVDIDVIDENLRNIMRDNSDDEEEDYDEPLDLHSESFKDALREAANFKKRKAQHRQKTRRFVQAAKQVDPVTRMKLSEANEAFVSNDLPRSMQLYEEVIELDPKNFLAYKTLGEIYKQRGDLEECLNKWYRAAHFNSWDGDFWAQVAELAQTLNRTNIMFYCYQHAVRNDTKDHKYLQIRTKVYEEVGELRRATSGYLKLHLYDPLNQQIVINLAKVYADQNRFSEAIDTYLKILNQNIEFYQHEQLEQLDKNFSDFEWSELNILAELYIRQGTFSQGLNLLKQTARWLQGRTDETFWNRAVDDSEFDTSRSSNPELRKLPRIKQLRPYDLPIDIRVKLGIFRLRMGQMDEAASQFNFLLDEPVNQVSDLYTYVGNSWEELGHYKEALLFFVRLAEQEEFNTVELVSSIAKCYHEIGDLDQAVHAYRLIIEQEPDNLDFKLALAETLYHLGAVEESRRLLEEIADLRKGQTRPKREPALEVHRKPKKKLSDDEKLALERKMLARTKEKYSRMGRLWPAVELKDPVATSAWLQLASELFEQLCSVKSIFNKERPKFMNLLVHKHREMQMNLDERLDRLMRLQQESEGNYKIDKSLTLTEAGYRGLGFDVWFEIFMQHSLLLAQTGEPKAAIQSIEISRSIVQFLADPQKDRVMKLVKLSVDSIVEDYSDILTALREILNSYQFSRNAYKMFVLCLPSGRKSLDLFISLNHQKYFLRQSRAWESIRLNRPVEGQAKIHEVTFNTDSINPYLAAIYSEVSLAGKSYLPSLLHLSRVYEEFKHDPMINLLLAVASSHRAMQRSVANRHNFVLQSLVFFDAYRKIRSPKGLHESQEVQYNLARLYHHYGLTTIAVGYYEKVLGYTGLDETYDLKKEAAYNLYLIYNLSGNHLLASQVMMQHLTI